MPYLLLSQTPNSLLFFFSFFSHRLCQSQAEFIAPPSLQLTRRCPLRGRHRAALPAPGRPGSSRRWGPAPARGEWGAGCPLLSARPGFCCYPMRLRLGRELKQSGSPGGKLLDDSWPGREQGLVPADGPSTCARCKQKNRIRKAADL